MTKQKIGLFAGMLLTIIFSGCLINKPANTEEETSVSNVAPGEVAVINNIITLTQPLNSDTIENPLKVKGTLSMDKPLVYFQLVDNFGNIFATSSAPVVKNDSGSYTFEAEFNFITPYSKDGQLQAFTLNGEQKIDDLVKQPIIFPEFTQLKVKAFFSNIKNDPNLMDCGKVYPLERNVQPSGQLPILALQELFKGLSEEEMNAGYITNLPEEKIELKNLEFKDGVFYVDFDENIQNGVGGSCRVSAIRAQISETLKQFPDVKDVVISVNGNSEEALQP